MRASELIEAVTKRSVISHGESLVSNDSGLMVRTILGGLDLGQDHGPSVRRTLAARVKDDGSVDISNGSETFRSLAAGRVSDEAVRQLGNWLVPCEPVLAVLTGQRSQASCWLVLTPLHIVEVTDRGGSAEIRGVGLWNGTGWRADPAWSGFTFVLETPNGNLTLGAVSEQDVNGFVRRMQEAYENLVNGPNPVDAIEEGMAAAMGLLDRLQALPGAAAALNHRPSAQVIAQDIRLAIAAATFRADGINLATAHLLEMLGYISESHKGGSPGDELVVLLDEEGRSFAAAGLQVSRLRDLITGSEDEDLWKNLARMLAEILATLKSSVLAGWVPHTELAAWDEVIAEVAGMGRAPANPETVNGVLDELQQLTGLDGVKNEVTRLVNLARVQAMRGDHGLSTDAAPRNAVFTGNPGTGKTTVARLLARLYQALGHLPQGHLVETSRADLVAGYVGQTALKTTEVFQRARGGVLFIDEAYSLAQGNGSGHVDYGAEAIDTLVKLMEDFRHDTLVIAAGYPDEMSRFLDSNPGLRSRFGRTIQFDDYTANELVEILRQGAAVRGYEVDQSLAPLLVDAFEAMPRGRGFGNGRVARQLLEDAIAAQATRLVSLANSPTKEELAHLQSADFEQAMAAWVR